MSVRVYRENGDLARYFPNLIDASIFVGATVDEIEVAIEKEEVINGYRLYT